MNNQIVLTIEQQETLKLLVFQGRKMEAIAKVIEWTGANQILAEAYLSQFIDLA